MEGFDPSQFRLGLFKVFYYIAFWIDNSSRLYIVCVHIQRSKEYDGAERFGS